MKQTLVQNKYPVFTLELGKDETTFRSVDEIIAFLKKKTQAAGIAWIGVFDHYAYTQGLENGEISDDIVDAKNALCCFGFKLNDPSVMALRPRSIGVVEMRDKFVINFLEAPMPRANEALEKWAKELRNA